MPRVLGITGRKRSGKDTLARTLIEYGGPWERVAFADAIKELATSVISPDILGTDGDKEREYQAAVNIDDWLPLLSEALGFELKPRKLRAKSPRQLLQYLGSEYVRSVRPGYWLHQVREKIESAPHKRFIVSDVRMADEAALVRELGGKVIEVRRLGGCNGFLAAGGVPEHETEDIDFRADYVLAVVDGNLAAPHALAEHDGNAGDLEDFLTAWDWNRLQKEKASPESSFGFYYGRHLWPELAGSHGR